MLSRLGRIRSWVAQQSVAMRVGVVLAALVVFRVAQMFAAWGEGIGRGDAVPFVVVGVVAIALAAFSLYLLYAVARSFIGGSGGEEVSSAEG